MAIQLTVCTPLFFYKEMADCFRPLSQAKRFCRDVNTALGTALVPDESREFFAQDIPAANSWRIYELLHEHSDDGGKRLRSILGSDPHLPFLFGSPREIRLPNYQRVGNACVSSTFAFSEAIQEVEVILPNFMAGMELSDCRDVLAVYRNAIKISEENRQPIFWSY